MNTPKIVLVVVVLIIIAGAAYFLTRPQPEAIPTETENASEVIEEDGMEEDSMEMENNTDVTEIELIGEDFSYDQEEITVKVGETVRIVLAANDMPHDFVIDELDVRTDIAQPGETVEIEFTATEAGEYEYYCSVGNHRAQGMVGTLIVTE